jgi:hypothetical protein
VAGVKRKWKYLLTLYGTVIIVNLLLVNLIFPALANFRLTDKNALANLSDNYSKLTVKFDLPCAGHAPLIIEELKRISGVSEVIFKNPDTFDVYYDPAHVSQDMIMSHWVFDDFKGQVSLSR